MARKKVTRKELLRQADYFRDKLRSPFAIRGTIRRDSFSTAKSLEKATGTIPVYHINPQYRMGSSQWFNRLRATFHASVARAIRKGLPTIYTPDLAKVSAENLPTIMVFGPVLVGEFKSGKQSILGIRQMLTGKRTDKFSHYRKNLEVALVKGKKMPTFMEGYLSASLEKDRLYIDQHKLFEIRLTKKELGQAVRKVNKDLARKGFPQLQKLTKPKDWAIVRKVLGVKKLHKPLETSLSIPGLYLLSEEISRIMFNKFLKRGKKWIEINIKD